MADSVYYHLERMLPELDDLQQRGLFSASEIKEIAKRRREFEFRLARRSKLKEDYLRYVEYEMQLESLRKLRKKALVRALKASKRKWQNSLCDRASAMRIMLIYERCVTRFKGDLDLWMQYLEYCRSQGTRRMQKVLTKALRLHPTVPGLWIYAAAWEFENNANVTAARALMQRGLRMCPQSDKLWLEYFRMELVYAQRLKANKSDSELEMRLPGVDGSDDSEGEENVGVALRIREDENKHVEKHPVIEEQGTGIIDVHVDELGYKLARAIYRNAIAAIPSSPRFRQSFVEILKGVVFEQASVLQDEIMSSLEKDFATDEGCWDWQARLQFETTGARDKSMQVYEKALKAVPSVLMYELYAKFLEEILDLKGHESRENATMVELYSQETCEVASALLQFYERAKESNLSPCLAEGHATILLRLGKVHVARELLERLCCGDFKVCASLWSMRISLEMKREVLGETSLSSIADLCEKGLKHIPSAEAGDVWHMILEYFAGQTTFYDRVVDMLINKMGACGGGQACAGMSISLIDWILYNQNINQARKAYNRFLALPGPSIDLYKHCISIEARMVAMNCEDTVDHVRRLFRSAVDVYSQDTGLWLEYCAQERKVGNLEAASAVYCSAKKILNDPSSFIEGHHHLLSAKGD